MGMMQNVIIILVIALSLVLLARKAYRTFVPAPGKACGGDCCSAGSKDPSPAQAAPAPRTQMVRSEDLARRAAEIKRTAP